MSNKRILSDIFGRSDCSWVVSEFRWKDLSPPFYCNATNWFDNTPKLYIPIELIKEHIIKQGHKDFLDRDGWVK